MTDIEFDPIFRADLARAAERVLNVVDGRTVLLLVRDIIIRWLQLHGDESGAESTTISALGLVIAALASVDPQVYKELDEEDF
jgi:uncharacterized membrane protein (DUF373 family)